MLKTFCGLLAAAALVLPASGAEPVTKGAYAGIAAGVVNFDDDDFFASYNVRLDNSASAARVYGGYRFTESVAVEFRYSQFGEFSATNGINTATFDIDALSAHVVGISPLTKNGLELFGQVGLALLQLDCDVCGDDENAGAFSFGVGLRYSITPRFLVALQGDAYIWSESGPVSDDYNPILYTALLGLQYTF